MVRPEQHACVHAGPTYTYCPAVATYRTLSNRLNCDNTTSYCNTACCYNHRCLLCGCDGGDSLTYGSACKALHVATNTVSFCSALLLVPTSASACVLEKFANMYNGVNCRAPPAFFALPNCCSPAA
jgi:hypothetical protein